MKKKRFLSILLSLALMLGVMPGTAFADGHTHDFEYSASGDTITATCKTEDCNLADNKVTLTIKAPENLYYNDTTVTHFATLENLDTFNAVTQRTYSADKIVYYKGSSQNTDIQNNKPKMATYTAKIALNPDASKTSSDFFTAGKFVSVTFAFTAKPVEHTHSFSYTANGAVITATCTNTTGTCDLTNKQAILTLNAPLHTTYGDGKDANATFTGEIPGATNPTINYRKSDTPLSTAPTDAGTYTAWCQLGNATASVEYTIGKATNNGWTTLPQAKQNLKYTGQPQALITAGTANAGNALYTVGTDPDNEPDDTAGGRPYTSSVPEMTNAGTYYVWCKIDGGKNYTSINAQKVEVTIAKANPTATAPSGSATYGQTLADVTLTNPEGNTPGTWAWVDSTTSVGSVGDNTFKANFTPTDTTNYNSVSDVEVTVNVGAVDKTELANAISAAESYYNQIKDNADYEEAANALKTAIDDAARVKDNDNVTADAVATAITTINTAKSTAETGVKDADDTKAANAVIASINALPAASRVTTSDKAAIVAARKAYDSLTADQKAKVSADTLKKLTGAENALAEAMKKAVTTVTVNTKTVNAKVVNAAIANAGGSSEYVTTIVLGKKVKKISKGAFKNYKNAKTLVVKTKKLKKSKVKKSLKGSKITKVKVQVGKKKTNKKYVKKYKRIFTKKNTGRKVKVTR